MRNALTAVFYSQDDVFTGFCISGHAGYGTAGNDIVCAAVSSAVELTCNTITEFFHAPADVSVGENEIVLKLKESSAPASQLLASLHLHIANIAEEHKKIKLEITKSGG